MRPLIFIVDDNPAMIQLVATMLADIACIRFATSGQRALPQMQASPPDLVLLDAEMPGMNGFELCGRLKADPLLADVPVIFLTAHDAVEFELKGLDAGAADFISKPISRPLLLARVRTQLRVKALTDLLRHQAQIDGLTEIANRRAFNEAVESEWRRTRRSGLPIATVLIDVDHFKLFNDHYGHLAGDACLRAVAAALRAVVSRPGDLVARYGGEEFALLLPETSEDGAWHIARGAVAAISRLELVHALSPTAPHVTVSAGVAFQAGGDPAASETTLEAASRLLQAADDALYAAKRAGRNQARGAAAATSCTPGLEAASSGSTP